MPKKLGHYQELNIFGPRPSVLNFARVGWFSEDRTNPETLNFAGPEALTISQRRLQGDDIVFLPQGLMPVVPNVTRFWNEIGLPVSPLVFPNEDAGPVPPGYRLLLGAYNPAYNRDGRYDKWRDIIQRVRTRGGFVGWLRERHLDESLPRTNRYGPDRRERPSRAQMEEYFAIAPRWWIKLDEEVLGIHAVLPADNVDQMVEAIEAMEGGAYVIQEHCEGDSYSISYEVTPSGRAIHNYTAIEMVVDGWQLGAWTHHIHDFIRKVADPIAQALADDGVEHHLGLGFIADRRTGRIRLNDNNIRQQGGHPVWQFLMKMRQAGGPALDEWYYEYLDPGDLALPELLEAILRSPLRPDIRTAGGIWPIGFHPNGGGKFAAYGPDARETVAEAKDRFGIHLRHAA